jgi:chromosome segregation ATPase
MKTVLKEIILENFMSYEYARVPLKKGLNIICGPNGAGKSSILLAISLALGQAHTERSKKLSELIRRGEDIARVSLIFDNTPTNGERPISGCRSDTFILSRYLKKNGVYWFEADSREKDKFEIERLLRGLGINPNNMLIIMHQHMVDKFSSTSSQEKLRMVEEAVGFHPYRQRISDAQKELSNLIGEEESLLRILESTENTLKHWRELRDRHQKKKSLLNDIKNLKNEEIWAQIIKQEKILSSLEEKMDIQEELLNRTVKNILEMEERMKKGKNRMINQQFRQKRLFFDIINLEKEKTEEEVLKRIGIKKNEEKEVEREIEGAQVALTENERLFSITMDEYVENCVTEGVLRYKKDELGKELEDIKRNIKEVENKLRSLPREGERIETQRSLADISGEMKLIKMHLQAFDDVPEDAEEMYESYTEMYEELNERLKIVTENKERAMEGIKERKERWKRELFRLLGEINVSYNEVLSKINADGRARLINLEEMDNAGLELSIGFRGKTSSILDSYTLSGGERSTAVVAFLLSLQRQVKSPIRAVDEFEVHMDPMNREAMFKQMFSSIGDGQYIVITPNPLTLLERDVNIIIVQNVHGESKVGEVE